MKVLLIATALAALPLGGCCLSLGGCEVPLSTAATSTDWDGLGQAPGPSAPTVITPDRTRRQARQANDDYTSVTTGNAWKDDQARLEADDARLKKKLVICDGCAGTRN